MFGLSSQTSEQQAEAAGRLHLPFALLSDHELELVTALGFAARFSDDGRQVQLEAKPKSSPTGGSITGVADLAPNFRVARLDGNPISLADFRGKRVLIQSWASW